ncbi:non-ribosomal peptide synthetase [Streptomyces sp. NRRL B-24085]|uniref:non-ribosomal peptide synthetase n=1 Tax=Streptomyces sp. NRRL B-24085 TaxID=1709476 RepID=UPI0006B3BD02|nr:non-ribosomal peptide synthetase [Streptomyces sp. NRRL B-24085]
MVPVTSRTAGTVDGLVVRQATRTPDAVAVTHVGQELTYAELVSRAGELAHRLTAREVRPGDVVALLMDRSVSFVVSALAVLMAGGAYLPLDRRHPQDRLRWMVEDAGAVLLLTDGPAAVVGWAGETPVEEVGPTSGPVPAPRRLPDPPAHPEHLAYVMYTSGSTGTPKGVANTHRNIVDFVTDPCWDPQRQARVLAYSPLGFDSSTYELWVPLVQGGRAVVWSPEHFDVAELKHVIARNEVTAAYFTTALFDTIAHEDPAALAPLRDVTTGGDVLSVSALRRVREHCPGTTVVHAYGPTETTVFCSLQPFAPDLRGALRLHLGTPMRHTGLYVLDDTLRPVPPGGTGELYVSGSHLARGYVGRPGLTAQRFLPDPQGAPGSRMYRTGDLARRESDGTLTFAGRVDRQVKLRGFRIEPAEIEAALVALPEVARAAVTLREDLPGGRGLAAYLVPRDRTRQAVDVDEARHHLSRLLPPYMVPSAFTVLHELPLTVHGKVDHSALPRPAASAEQGPAPRTPLEEKLCGLFSEILQCPPVGVDDNFFQLGGQSLLAIRLGARIRETTDHAVTIRDLFRYPTVARLAAHLTADTAANRET